MSSNDPYAPSRVAVRDVADSSAECRLADTIVVRASVCRI